MWPSQGLKPFSRASRYDRRFYLAGALVLASAIVAKVAGADGFDAYPTIQLGFSPGTVALAVLLVLSGLVPLRRRPKRLPVSPVRLDGQVPPRGPGAAATMPVARSHPRPATPSFGGSGV